MKIQGYATLRGLPGRLRRGLRFARYLVVVPDRFWVGQLLAAGIVRGSARLTGNGRELQVQGFAVPLRPEERFILFSLDCVPYLQAALGGVFTRDSAGRLRYRLGTLEFSISTEEELRILVEIYVLGTYNYALPAPAVVCDIGMNVGFASLYFAAKPGTIVYGFEPIRDTYEAALSNFALNPGLSASITSANVGLAAQSRTETVLYSPKLKGLSGNRDTIPLYQRRGERFMPRQIELRAITEVLGDITQRHPDRPLVVKMDCEGAEYELVAALQQEGMLQDIALLMIEWHARGSEPLAAPLRDAGFAVFSFAAHDQQSGMVYASRMLASPPTQAVNGAAS